MNIAFYWSFNNRSKKGLPHMACFLYHLHINSSPGNKKKATENNQSLDRLQKSRGLPKHLQTT
jgi:hypothetical protein